MQNAKKADFITVEQYLKNERVSDVKYEYVDGQVYAMSGASLNHGRVCTNIARLFGNHLHNGPCELFVADMQVKTPTGQYRYPDIVVTCDNDFIDDNYATQTPTILVEVLSRSTRRIDEKAKQLAYINIPTLKEYVLIEQDIADIRVLRKSDDWRATHYFLGEDIHFESIDLTVSVAEIYQRVENQDVAEFLAQTNP
ncbi:MAG: Uma2 family endonuclease [Psychrosphaera sp.]|nr:Uma2 family endonuclease [Psychrosphaera sp.]